MQVRRLVGWKICTDPGNQGVEAGWLSAVPQLAVDAPVPGIIQQVFPDYHGIAWYWCEVAPFSVPAGYQALLRFESVDYAARVWLNGHAIGGHENDGVPFELDATPYIEAGQPNFLRYG